MKRLLLTLLLTCAAWGQTRPVDLSWTASPSPAASVLGYNVSRGTSTSGPFTLLNTAVVTGLAFTDLTAVIGQTYTYQVVTVGNPCTPTTPVGTPCGQSAPASATTTVPAQPGGVITLTIIIP